MAPLTLDSPIAVLGIKTQAPTVLEAVGITTVRKLIASKRAAIGELAGMGDSRLAAIDTALAAHRLHWQDDRATQRTCISCPACETCGNPRATSRKAVTTLFGRYKHIGLSGIVEPCDDCETHHRGLFGVLPAGA